MSRPAVFLDRDGVLNVPVVASGRERPPWTLDELQYVPGIIDCLDALRVGGFLLVAVTNQPDVGRGRARAVDIESINDHVTSTLRLDAVYVCVHDGITPCDCRKPLPGMLHDAARDLDIELPASWLIGDRWVDIAAGRAAGVRSLLVDRPGSWDATSAGSPPAALRPDAVVADLAEAVRMILGESMPR